MLKIQLPAVVLLALAGGVLAEPAAVEAPAPVVESADVVDEQAVQQVTDYVLRCATGIQEIVAVLQSVKDTAGADAAADKVAALTKTVRELETKFKALPQLGTASINAVNEKLDASGYSDHSIAVKIHELAALHCLLKAAEPPFHGSQKLQSALDELVACLDFGYDEAETEDDAVDEQAVQRWADMASSTATCLREMAEALQGVQDLAGADAAAVKIAGFAETEDDAVDEQAVQRWGDIVSSTATCLREMAEALQGVQDLAGADAAAVKIAGFAETTRKMADVKEECEKSTVQAFVDALEAELVRRGYTEEALQALTDNLSSACLKLKTAEPPFYGSQKLPAALQETLAPLRLDFVLEVEAE